MGKTVHQWKLRHFNNRIYNIKRKTLFLNDIDIKNLAKIVFMLLPPSFVRPSLCLSMVLLVFFSEFAILWRLQSDFCELSYGCCCCYCCCCCCCVIFWILLSLASSPAQFDVLSLLSFITPKQQHNTVEFAQ